jgi:hypothetical protein
MQNCGKIVTDFRWTIVLSDRKISKKLLKKISVIRIAGCFDKGFYLYTLDDLEREKLQAILQLETNQYCTITNILDKQFGETYWYYGEKRMNEVSQILKNKYNWQLFYWGSDGQKAGRVTAITKMQHNSTIHLHKRIK